MTRIGFKLLTFLSIPYIRLPMPGSYVCQPTEAGLVWIDYFIQRRVKRGATYPWRRTPMILP
jgi:hypothetical protein